MTLSVKYSLKCKLYNLMARLFTSQTIKHPFQDSFFARERHLGFLFNKYSFECKTNMLLVVDEKSEKEIIIYVHDTSTCILPVKEKNIFVSYEIFFFFRSQNILTYLFLEQPMTLILRVMLFIDYSSISSITSLI